MDKIKILSEKEKRSAIRDYIKKAPELSNRAISRSLGVAPTTVGKYRKELEERGALPIKSGQVAEYSWLAHPYLKAHPELLVGLTPRQLRAIKKEGVLDVMAEKSSVNPVYCQQILHTRDKEMRKDKRIKLQERDIKIFQHDIRKELYDVNGKTIVDDESVDLILTDPMYDLKSVQTVYPHISRVAGRCLKQGGILLVMVGQAHLPEALTALLADKRLVYHWIISYGMLSKASAGAMQFKKVVSHWKPIIVISKGAYSRGLAADTLVAPKDIADKTEYIYGQSVEALKTLIERYTEVGEVVMDVCCGGGSCAEACILSNRKFIGCDISTEAVTITKKRVKRLFGDTDKTGNQN